MIWRRSQDGVMAGGMEAQDHSGARGALDLEALDANRNAAVGADLDRRTGAPNVRPPRASWGWTKNGPLFLLRGFPSVLRGHPQFAMGLVDIAMEPQSLDVGIGGFHVGNLFAGEIGWESALPELVFAFDLPFSLGCWSIKEADVVELERPTQLSHRFGILGEENGVVIDVDLQRSSVAEKSRREEIKVGQEKFSIVELGTNEQATAIVEHIEHGKVQGGGGKPMMG